MPIITAEELLAFLTYLAEHEIIPRSGASIHAVNFTLREIRTTITGMQDQGQLYQAFLRHKSEDGTYGSS